MKFLLLLAGITAINVSAHAGAPVVSPAPVALQWGADYTDVPASTKYKPVNSREVILFYSILCKHCYKHEPALAAWEKKNSKLPVIRKAIVLAKGKRVEHAMAAAHLDSKPDAGKHRAKLFDAVHKTREAHSLEGLRKWMTANGHGAAWERSTRLRKAVEGNYALAKKLQLTGVPAAMVGGKYVMTVGASQHPMTAVLDSLVSSPPQNYSATGSFSAGPPRQ